MVSKNTKHLKKDEARQTVRMLNGCEAAQMVEKLCTRA